METQLIALSYKSDNYKFDYAAYILNHLLKVEKKIKKLNMKCIVLNLFS